MQFPTCHPRTRPTDEARHHGVSSRYRWSRVALLVLVLGWGTSWGSGADILMLISGVPGESTAYGHAGWVGIPGQGFERFSEWVRDARDLVRDCTCESGCPSCIQSPKCGNWNEPLDKEAAIRLLEAML